MKTASSKIRTDEHEALCYVKRFLTNKPLPNSIGLTSIFDKHYMLLMQGSWDDRFPSHLDLPAIRPHKKPLDRLVAIYYTSESPQNRERYVALSRGNVSQRIRNVLRAAYASVVLDQNPKDFLTEMPIIGQTHWCWTSAEYVWTGVAKRGVKPIGKLTDLTHMERIAVCCAALNRGTSFEEALCPAPPESA